MPQVYKRKPGSRSYRTYNPELISAALRDIRSGKSIAFASRKYGIPRSTLQNKINGKHMKKPGGQTALTVIEEEVIAKAVIQLVEWSYPLTKSDIQIIIKKYLDKEEKAISTFKDNIPGKGFMAGFMKRHKLTQRMATNISKSRASVLKEDVSKFFQNIQSKLQNAPPTNIFNFDETNLTDDPGAKKVVALKGCKRVQRVMEHSKVAISLMFAISAAGEILPPYVVYKADNLYENWCSGGPHGTQYGVSRSGWFDSSTFEAWFETIFLPFVQNRSGEKIVIADNLASHFSPKVINLCVENDIFFTTIPPNSTHFMQPLDVAFFRPLKIYWRHILESWRKESRRRGTIPKEVFPSLLKRLYNKLEDSGAQNAISGFKKTGLYPFNPEEALKMLPSTSGSTVDPEKSVNVLNASVLEFLKEQLGSSSNQSRRRRGRKIIPGSAVTFEGSSDVIEQQNNENLCAICRCDYTKYRGPDWIQCFYCKKWICGFCNRQSKVNKYMCEICLDED